MTSDDDYRTRINSYHNGQGHITQVVKIRVSRVLQHITKLGSQDAYKISK